MVVAAVAEHGVGSSAGWAALAADRRGGLEQRDELGDVVAVAAGPCLGPHQQPPLPLIQMWEQHPEPCRELVTGLVRDRHTTPFLANEGPDCVVISAGSVLVPEAPWRPLRYMATSQCGGRQVPRDRACPLESSILQAWTAVTARRGQASRSLSVIKVALAADTVSIAVMELVDNGIIALVPGAMDAHLSDTLFWTTLLGGLAVAFVITTPVNMWMIGRGKGHAVVHAYH